MREEKIDAISEYISDSPRTTKDLESYFVPTYMSRKTLFIILNKLLRLGKIIRQKSDNLSVYSLCNDPRLSFLSEVIQVYDKTGYRINKIAGNWNNVGVTNLVEDEDEVTANVQSFSNENNFYSVKISEDDFYCTCNGATFHENHPCVHILKLALERDRMDWLINWIGGMNE